ncbi:LysR family transcriptional regulator [Luteibacter sp. PPL201]|uniref:LysR family transcriptional regulator n=1 Tax=Luteibacter sahnii TaxID=3021977 RepID=A0ABT6B5Z1_9GAMM
MDLNALDDFQLVATQGGFGKASRASGRSKATLSRRVAELEDAMGVRLIERGSHRLALTEAGRLLLQRVEGPMREVAEAVAAARDGVSTPRGRLRVSAPQLFSQLALGHIAARFVATYPQVQVETVTEDRVVDLVDEHVDVAIRINPRTDSDLVGRCFARDRLLLVAPPGLPRPAPAGPAPTPMPAVVMPTYRDGDVWSAREGGTCVQPLPVLYASSLLMIRDAVAAGAGVALLPQSIAAPLVQTGDVAVWGVVGEPTELWVLHTSRRLQSPKVRAFVDFIGAQFPDGTFTVPARAA